MALDWHLAQVNIALMKAPLESPEMADFVAQLEPVNALADSSPGFIWRLQTEDGDATAVRAFGDDRLIVNMSVWKSVDVLWSSSTTAATSMSCAAAASGFRAWPRRIRLSGGSRPDRSRAWATPRSVSHI